MPVENPLISCDTHRAIDSTEEFAPLIVDPWTPDRAIGGTLIIEPYRIPKRARDAQSRSGLMMELRHANLKRTYRLGSRHLLSVPAGLSYYSKGLKKEQK